MGLDTATAAAEQTEPSTLGPHPIFDALLADEPEGGWVREVFGLGHRDELAPALEPDEVHDPLPIDPRLILRARVISSTPTGSLMLDMGPGRSVDLTDALARHDQSKYLAGLEIQDAQ